MPWSRHLSHAFASQRRFWRTIFGFWMMCVCVLRLLQGPLPIASEHTCVHTSTSTAHTQNTQSVAGVYSSAHNNDNRFCCHSTMYVVDTGFICGTVRHKRRLFSLLLLAWRWWSWLRRQCKPNIRPTLGFRARPKIVNAPNTRQTIEKLEYSFLG